MNENIVKIKGLKSVVSQVLEDKGTQVFYSHMLGEVVTCKAPVGRAFSSDEYTYEIVVPDPKVQKFTTSYLRKACEETWVM